MDLDGNVVKEWNSMTDASKALKINLSFPERPNGVNLRLLH